MTAPASPDGSAVTAGHPAGVAPERDTRAQTLATRVALVVALACLLLPGLPAGAAILAAIACIGLLAASARWSVGRATIVVLVLTGLALRLQPPTGFSDVLIVTEAAIREALAASGGELGFIPSVVGLDPEDVTRLSRENDPW